MRRKKILLRSSWQTVNIGDIAHTPGVLAILEKHLPEYDIALWGNVGDGVEDMLQERFPHLEIKSEPLEFDKLCDECDFLLHGSGPSLVAHKDVTRWRELTDKPYGVFGISIRKDVLSDDVKDHLNNASFAYFRDSPSLAFCKSQGISSPVMAFGPDGAFATDLLDDVSANNFLEENGLEKEGFVCCIPRYRNTPYWLLKEDIPFKKANDDQNQKMKEHDHKPLYDAIIKLVEETPYKVLICPEDRSQVAIGKEMLYDRLPENIKERVVWRDRYWLTSEARSVYKQSVAMFGLEMHTPIMCVGMGIPAIVGRFETQTTKGYMWEDIGLGEWLFDFDVDAEIETYATTVVDMVKDLPESRLKTAKAREFVMDCYANMAGALKKLLSQ